MPAIKCVYCKKNEADSTRGVYPFCSERCKLLDLGAWTDESYRVPCQDDGASLEDLDEHDGHRSTD